MNGTPLLDNLLPLELAKAEPSWLLDAIDASDTHESGLSGVLTALQDRPLAVGRDSHAEHVLGMGRILVNEDVFTLGRAEGVVVELGVGVRGRGRSEGIGRLNRGESLVKET